MRPAVFRRITIRRVAGVPIVAVLLAAVGCGPGRYDDAVLSAGVRDVLRAQADAWNRGDIDGFMRYYEKSESLTFSGGGKTERGWQATYDRYKRKYPTAERMGKLTFGELEITRLDDGGYAALVLGRWFLERAPDPVGGNFSLVMLRAKGDWRILHDHTSVDPDAGNAER